MTKELWINLPVKNVKATKEFFTAIGFTLNTQYADNDVSVCFLVGTKNIAVMFFEEQLFKTIVQNGLAETAISSEVLFSFDAESREEVDEMAKKVEAAGGIVFAKPEEVQGWMYGFAFADPSGHRWNMLYMDMSKLD